MALTRDFLTDLGLQEDVMQKIIDGHDEAMASAKQAEEQFSQRLKALEDEKAALENQTREALEDDVEWRARFENIKCEFDAFKTAVETEKTDAAKRGALRRALKTEGANEKLVELLESKFDISRLELNNGEIKSWEELVKPVKEQFSELFGKIETVGAGVATPPKGDCCNNYVTRLDAARKANDTAAAVKIKTEAAKEGVFLI